MDPTDEKIYIVKGMGRTMLIAVTGTPGTGKTTACALLKGVTVVDLRKLAEAHKGDFTFDKKRGSLEIDPAVMRGFIPKSDDVVVLEGNVSHLLKPDIAIVLRCSPKVLRKRLAKRKWSEKKIQENVEAEAVDVILIEAMESCKKVFEIDTTKMTARKVAGAIASIISGERGKYRPGDIDWSGEVLDWY
jgi:adenylate kinase